MAVTRGKDESRALSLGFIAIAGLDLLFRPEFYMELIWR